jgi:hypothetical protein
VRRPTDPDVAPIPVAGRGLFLGPSHKQLTVRWSARPLTACTVTAFGCSWHNRGVNHVGDGGPTMTAESSMAEVEHEGTTGRHDPPGEAPADDPQLGASPYATGGGGVTFERKVAVTYLAHLLTGAGAAELGDGRRVVSVRFQQAPEHAVDDLVVHAAREDEVGASLVLALGVRRSPEIVQSDVATAKLVMDFIRGVIDAPADGLEHRFALVVAGSQPHAEQLAELAYVAGKQMNASEFFHLIRTPQRYRQGVRGRLDQFESLVRKSLIGLGRANPDDAMVKQHAWDLLSRLTVLMPRLEAPDETDWSGLVNALVTVSRGGDLAGATSLRDRLAALAAEYAPTAGTVDLSLLRRDAYTVLDAQVRRQSRGWGVLGHFHERAVTAVRDTIRSGDGERNVHIDRDNETAALLSLAVTGTAVVVHGDSGVGKSALAVLALSSVATVDPTATQVLCINLRDVPAATVEFEFILGWPLALLLAELGAPRRLLVIDGADAAAEGKQQMLRYLIDAAHAAGLGVVAVSSTDNKQVVSDALAARFANVVNLVVPALTDAQIGEVVAAFPELSNLAANARSRSLLQRAVMIDLFVRGGVSGIPLSDADAMQHVWNGLVRRHEQSDRGTPDARQVALLRLADLSLSGGDPLQVVGALDAVALDGLLRDGLLLRPLNGRFNVDPAFAHDEVRRYAVARLLLMTDPVTKLHSVGVPRWALGAARLACQALLAAPRSDADPLHGRFERLQAAFDGLVSAGHGERWGDVPGEALLTMSDPDPVLRGVWPQLRADDDAGLQRLCRLVNQRLHDESDLVRVVAVEPLIGLLLDDTTPWVAGKHVQDVVRDWLRALVVAGTAAGDPLRELLRDRLVAAGATADLRLEQQRAAQAATRAARTPDEIEEARQLHERNSMLFTEIGRPQRRAIRRDRHLLPPEITDKIFVELLSLLGPDLGEGGEVLLRRVAEHAPSSLAPAVEELFTGRALSNYRQGFLAEVTEAYYLNDEEDGSGFHEHGIRHHQARSLGVLPLAAWYRGPFMALFQTDFRDGVAALNRMLNHAAHAHARTFAGHGMHGHVVGDSYLDKYRTELNITGTRRVFIGDPHVYTWYRGNGVGPYPCMSALQALERVCDELIQNGVTIANLVAILLDGCENLAMVGLVVGILVRHLEKVDHLLNPCLAEPMMWHLEFGRLVKETSGLAASSDGIMGAERRHWSLREAAMFLVVRADDERATELRAIGDQLVATRRREIEAALLEGEGEEPIDDEAVERHLITVRAWASGLNWDNYEAEQTDHGLLIQNRPPDDIVQAMQASKKEIERSHSAVRLTVRYLIDAKKWAHPSISAEELEVDLAEARALLVRPPTVSADEPWDVPTAVAAYALEAHLLHSEVVLDDLLTFAADTVLRVAHGEGSPRQFEFDETYFDQGADRSAARVLPLLMLPNAATLRTHIDGRDGSSTHVRAVAGAANLARAVSHEVRVQLASGLDSVWSVPCAEQGRCHHEDAYGIVIESARDSAFGGWDPEAHRRIVTLLPDPIAQSLASVAGNDIYVSRLDAAIRSLSPAAMASICVSSRAQTLLEVLLAAHRRGFLSHEHDMDSRGTHALVAARALLTTAGDGDGAPIFKHLDAYADNTALLGSFLRGLSAAAEEASTRAATARRLWPDIVARVLALQAAGHSPFDGRLYGDHTLASLIPNLAGEVTYLYRELQGDPLVWWDPLALQSTVESWLPIAAGQSTCVDHIIHFLGAIDTAQQARVGIPWVAQLVLPDPLRIANRTYLLESWLTEIRAAAEETGSLANWQRIVDALVVAGASRLAPYSE